MTSAALIISGGVSIGVLAGVVTGIVYLIITGIRALRAGVEAQEAGWSEGTTRSACVRCGRSVSLVSFGRSRRLQCSQCRLTICPQCCHNTSLDTRLCSTCAKLRDVRLQTGDWFYAELRKRFKSTVAALSDNEKSDGEVRDFMEKLVETLVGGNLDSVQLSPLSSHPQCKSLPNGEAPTDIHTELKQIIEEVIHEAMNLPSLKSFGNGFAHDPELDELDSKSYEDILATAILNKVIEKYHQELRKKESSFSYLMDRPLRSRHSAGIYSGASEESSSIANSQDDCSSWSESSRNDPVSLTIEECIEEVTTRYSSEEDQEEPPTSELDRFLAETKLRRRQRAPFPELGMDIIDGSGSDENEQSAGVELVNPVDSWEENWLFQKRRLKTQGGTCHQPVPVPMLVPNPSQDFRALIGDVDADETSDLSECSDSVLEELLEQSDYQGTVYSSGMGMSSSDIKTETLSDRIESDFMTRSIDSDDCADKISSRGEDKTPGSDHKQFITLHDHRIPDIKKVNTVGVENRVSNCGKLTEAKNEELLLTHSDSGEGSLEMQQDSEYTVAYAAVAQLMPNGAPATADTKPTPRPRTLPPDPVSSLGTSSENNLPLSTELESEDISTAPPRPGSIAEREHLKWQQAPPLQNNPYSKENIERRQSLKHLLSQRSSSETSLDLSQLQTTPVVQIDCSGRDGDYKQYRRDYYINKTGGDSEVKGKKEHQKLTAVPDHQTPPLPCLKKGEQGKQQVSVRVEVDVTQWPRKIGEDVEKPQVRTQTKVVVPPSAEQKRHVTTISTWTDTKEPRDDEQLVSLPSVRELARQFAAQGSPVKIRPKTNASVSAGTATKRLEVQTSPIRQVHSLTARSISREFREGLRGGVTALSKQDKAGMDTGGGHISDDSGTVSPTPSAPNTQQSTLHDNIAFWEQLQQQR